MQKGVFFVYDMATHGKCSGLSESKRTQTRLLERNSLAQVKRAFGKDVAVHSIGRLARDELSAEESSA